MREVLQSGQFTSYVRSADQSSDRAPAYDVWLYAGLSQRIDDADVRPAAGCATAERKTDPWVGHRGLAPRGNSPRDDLRKEGNFSQG